MKKLSLLLMSVVVFALSCKENTKKQDEEAQKIKDQAAAMQPEETQNEWVDLFNGENLEGWKAFNADTITQWKVEDGALAFTPTEGERSGSENLISKDEFSNFELSLEWKISEAGNSGIIWGVQEDKKFKEPYLTGAEIQVLDNQKHPDAKNGPIRQAGALYDMVPPSKDVTKPVGEWNQTVIKIDHVANLGTVTTNGEKITEFPVHGDEWDKMVKGSKFKDWQDFGKYRSGHIALQDHGNKVWYRNIKIKKLK